MKNVLIGIFAGISALSLGYIGYSDLSDKGTTCPAFDKAQECSKDVCDRLYGNDDNIDEEDREYVIFEKGRVYTNGKSYVLESYFVTGMENGKIEIQLIDNVEMKDGILYVNNKEIGHADTLYVTNEYIFVTGAGIIGDVFTHVIDAKGNVTNLENNKNYGEVQATNVYLKETGEVVAVGNKYCGIECTSDTEVVTFKNNNGKLEITKTKLK